MFDCNQLRAYIIRPALKFIHMYSEGAEEMLIAICAQESDGGTYLKQEGGPALGIYQMEPSTHDDIWARFLMISDKEGKTINSLGYNIIKACRFIINPPAEVMIHNLYYATMMARCFWLRVPDPLPLSNDFNGLWRQYKRYWNTEKGLANKDEFVHNYNAFTNKHILIDSRY